MLILYIDFQLHMNPGTRKKVCGGVVHAEIYLENVEIWWWVVYKHIIVFSFDFLKFAASLGSPTYCNWRLETFDLCFLIGLKKEKSLGISFSTKTKQFVAVYELPVLLGYK